MWQPPLAASVFVFNFFLSHWSLGRTSSLLQIQCTKHKQLFCILQKFGERDEEGSLHFTSYSKVLKNIPIRHFWSAQSLCLLNFYWISFHISRSLFFYGNLTSALQKLAPFDPLHSQKTMEPPIIGIYSPEKAMGIINNCFFLLLLFLLLFPFPFFFWFCFWFCCADIPFIKFRQK